MTRAEAKLSSSTGNSCGSTHRGHLTSTVASAKMESDQDQEKCCASVLSCRFAGIDMSIMSTTLKKALDFRAVECAAKRGEKQIVDVPVLQLKEKSVQRRAEKQIVAVPVLCFNGTLSGLARSSRTLTFPLSGCRRTLLRRPWCLRKSAGQSALFECIDFDPGERESSAVHTTGAREESHERADRGSVRPTVSGGNRANGASQKPQEPVKERMKEQIVDVSFVQLQEEPVHHASVELVSLTPREQVQQRTAEPYVCIWSVPSNRLAACQS